MERLTIRYDAADRNAHMVCAGDCANDSEMCGCCPELDKIVDRLAAYEDAEEQGLLVRLPCKAGDTVYIVKGSAIYSEKVRTFFLGHPSHRIEQRNMRMMRLESYDVPFDQFGKTVFLTREEAEAALANSSEEM